MTLSPAVRPRRAVLGPKMPKCAALASSADPSQGCTATACTCDPSEGWFCTADCGGGSCIPVDAATPGASCPTAQPAMGSTCVGPIACSFPGLCGSVIFECGTTQSYWAVATTAMCNGACPAAEPKVGDPCMAPAKCSYTSACGANDTVFCNGTGTVSMIMAGTCPACPSQEPAPFSSCSVAQQCMFTNACAGTDVATCSKGEWSVLRGDCEM